jgi:glucose-1-phosphate cytidylyltransferase
MISKDSPVIILCGGEGTRIADVSGGILPKPLIRIGDQPILWHIMKIYASYGFKNFVLALGHLSWEIKSHFLNYRLLNADFHLNLSAVENGVTLVNDRTDDDWSITFAETGPKTNTARRIALCRQYVDTEYFMVTYGDGVADIDLNALTALAVQMDTIGTVTSVTPSSRFGNIEINTANQVLSFAEKEDAGGGNINGGFFVFKKDFMDVVEKYGDVMLEREPMIDLVSRGELSAYRHSGFWEPMDTMREYRQLNQLWESGEAKWRRW